MQLVIADLMLQIDQKRENKVKLKNPLFTFKKCVFISQSDHRLLTKKLYRFP